MFLFDTVSFQSNYPSIKMKKRHMFHNDIFKNKLPVFYQNIF